MDCLSEEVRARVIVFAHPRYLLLALSAPLCAWLLLRRNPAGAAPRGIVAARTALLLLLALAAAGLQAPARPRGRGTVFVVDRSMSVAPADQDLALRWVRRALETRRPGDRAAVVSFGGRAIIEAGAEGGARLDALDAPVPRESTDIAGALRLAQAILPADSAGRIVLLSDGLETEGDMLSEAAPLVKAGVPVDAVPLSAKPANDVVVDRVEGPGEVAAREPFDIRAEVWSSTRTAAKARLFGDGRLLSVRDVLLPPGRSEFSFPARLDEPGVSTYSVLFDAPGDSRPQNNQGSTVVSVRGPPTALIVEGTPGRGEGLEAALSASGIRARRTGAGGFPRGLAQMSAYSLMILDNLPAYSLSPRSQEEIRAFVADVGGGLAMIGGDHSFAAGGYQGTPIEDALPVNMEPKRPNRELSLAIVVVVDNSGSMAMLASGVQKIQLAAEGAVKIVESLRPEQRIGICAVDTQPNWIVPLGPAAAKGAMAEQIRRLRAGGGGIYVYTGLEAAFQALGSVKAAVKHVILFSDAADAEEKEKGGRSAIDLIAQMNAAGITVSTIGLGKAEDTDAGFLELAAKTGRGRSYLTDDPATLPSIFIREGVLSRRAAFVQERFIPRVKRTLDPMRGIDWERVPELRGYVVAEAKDAAEVGLVSHRGDPILATWRYGLGRGLAFTSDAHASWSEAWSAWPGSGKLWAQAARWAARSDTGRRLSVRADLRGSEARLVAEASGRDGAPLNFLEIEGVVLGPELSKTRLRFQQAGPGRYEASMPAGGEGAYVVRAQARGADADLSRVSSFVVPYPAEFRRHETDTARLARLAELTRGRWNPRPEDAFLEVAGLRRRRLDASGWLLAAASLMLFLDVALRRLRWRTDVWTPVAASAKSRWRSAFASALRAAGQSARMPASEAERTLSPDSAASWERLKGAKKRARKKLG